jgi:hypothetical protein
MRQLCQQWLRSPPHPFASRLNVVLFAVPQVIAIATHSARRKPVSGYLASIVVHLSAKTVAVLSFSVCFPSPTHHSTGLPASGHPVNSTLGVPLVIRSLIYVCAVALLSACSIVKPNERGFYTLGDENGKAKYRMMGV